MKYVFRCAGVEGVSTATLDALAQSINSVVGPSSQARTTANRLKGLELTWETGKDAERLTVRCDAKKIWTTERLHSDIRQIMGEGKQAQIYRVGDTGTFVSCFALPPGVSKLFFAKDPLTCHGAGDRVSTPDRAYTWFPGTTSGSCYQASTSADSPTAIVSFQGRTFIRLDFMDRDGNGVPAHVLYRVFDNSGQRTLSSVHFDLVSKDRSDIVVDLTKGLAPGAPIIVSKGRDGLGSMPSDVKNPWTWFDQQMAIRQQIASEPVPAAPGVPYPFIGFAVVAVGLLSFAWRKSRAGRR